MTRDTALSQRAAPYLLFACVTALLLPEVVLQGKVFVGNSDRVNGDIPLLHLAAQSLRVGALPFWNSYSFCGSVGIGNHALRLLYPANLAILLLFPFNLPAATSWRFVLELFLLMALYHRFFLKVFRDGPQAALAALAASLSIFSTSWFSGGHLPLLFLPAILHVVWDWPERPMRPNVCYLTLAIFLQITSGYHHLTAYGLVFAFSVSMVRTLYDRRTQGRTLVRLIGLWTGSVGLAFIMDSLELIPFLEGLGSSNRTSASYAQWFGAWQQPAYMAWRILLPGFLGGVSNFASIEGNFNINYSEAFAAYAGVTPVLLAVIAARKWRRADTWPWLAALLILSACSLRTPFAIVPYLFFGKMPVAHYRLAALAPICLAFLASTGLKRFQEGPRDFQRSCVIQLAAAVVAIFLVAAGVLGPNLSLQGWLPTQAWTTWAPPDIPTRFHEAARVFLTFGAATVAVLALHWRGRIGAGALARACVALVAVDLVCAARWHAIFKEFSADSNWYPPSPITAYLDRLPDRGLYRFHLGLGSDWADVPVWHRFWPLVNIVYRLHATNGTGTYVNRRYALLAGKGIGDDFRATPDHIVDTPQMADLLGVKYFVVPKNEDSRSTYGPFTRPLFEAGQTVVFAKPDALPRFHLACGLAHTPETAKGFLDEIHSGRESLRDTVFLEEDWPGAAPVCPLDPKDSLVMQEVRPGRLSGTARLSRPGALVITETFDPSWQATVNGAPVPILRANFNFQAIPLPVGEASIEFRYRFRHLGACVWGLATALLTVGAGLAWPLLRRAASRVRFVL